MNTKKLLQVEDLKTWFYVTDGIIKAVDGVSFDVNKGEVLGLVGESGCGKSVTSRSIMRLVPDPPGKIVGGKVFFEGVDLLCITEEEMRKYRGSKIAMSFQDPMTYLNPVFKVGDQISEALMIHQGIEKKDALDKSIELMEMVQIQDPSQRAQDYPHQLSGGMRQRILLAMGISCNPQLLIADEPTTALDVIVQAEVLDLLEDLKKRLNLSLILITHDMGVVAQLADKIAIMYAGRIMEQSDVETIFHKPKNPYTVGLIESLPNIDERQDRLVSIAGDVPDLIDPPSGCRFHPRCPYAKPICSKEIPVLRKIREGHIVACHRADEF